MIIPCSTGYKPHPFWEERGGYPKLEEMVEAKKIFHCRAGMRLHAAPFFVVFHFISFYVFFYLLLAQTHGRFLILHSHRLASIF